MSFERLAFQSWMEGHLGCRDLTRWESYRQKIEECLITTDSLPIAISALDHDATSLLHKGLLSFIGACNDLSLNNRSWAIVKLYYSLFYTIRARLCFRRHGLIRNKSWYHFDVNSSDSAAIRLNGKRDRYRNDHECALHLYEDIFANSDILISNMVEGSAPFSWMMELRNIANYRLARFPDPEFPLDLTVKLGVVDASTLEKIIDDNISDSTHVLMFQPEYAWIAIPMKQILAAYTDLVSRGQSVTLPREQYEHTNRIFQSLPSGFRQAFDLTRVFKIRAET
jgi:hypothetical protein